MKKLDRMVKAAQEDVARAERRLLALSTMPAEPDYDTNVIYFEKQFRPDGPVYTYAAVKVNGYWYITGSQQGGVPRSWEDLMLWLGPETDVWFATEYTNLREM